MTVPRVRIGDIATRVLDEIPVHVDATYETVGILNRGRGLFRRPAISGAATSYAKFYRISSGQLVYSKLFAWEGSIAVVPSEFDGACVSAEFPTFELDREHVLPEYLSHVVRWVGFTDQLAASTTGLGQRRQRVNVEDLVQIEVPLPKIDEQRRIAAHLEAIADHVGQLMHQAGRTASARHAANGAIDDWIVESGAPTPMHKIAVINPHPVPVRPDDEVTFVPMAAVDPSAGAIRASEVRRRSELTSGYKQFLSGDLIFARITPCMQNGKCAIYVNADGRVAYGSTEFLVLRPRDPHLSEWLHAVLRTEWFRNQAARAFTGTAGQQRVPAAFISDVAIPLPDRKRRAQALAQLSDLGRLDLEVHRTAEKRAALAKALLPAARNEIFSAMR